MKAFAVLALVAGCSAAAKEDPCPKGICTNGTGSSGGSTGGTSTGGTTTAGTTTGGATTGGTTTGGTTTGGTTGGGCVESWMCTQWAPTSGMYTRVCTDANRCGTTNSKPPEGPIGLPALDFDYFKCKVEPILDRGCGQLACHGVETGRALRIFSRGRLRNDETVQAIGTCLETGPVNLRMRGTATIMCEGRMAHTAAEWQKNFVSARAFMLGLTDPEQSEMLTQPKIGGKAHAGVHLFATGSADYNTIRDWLGGATLGTTCNTGGN